MPYRDSAGGPRNRLVYRADESTLDLVTAGRAWTLDEDVVSMEIRVQTDVAVPDKITRTVTANCKTLKFKLFGFKSS